MEKKNIFLDFDGVLFNTLKEAYILCRYAYSGIDYFEPINKDEYEQFYRFKFLVYNSWQFYYIMMLLTEDLSDDEFISKFEELMNNRNIEKELYFDKKYYSARKDLMENYREFWDKLESPFGFFYEIKNLYDTDKIEIVIVSKKNKEAIQYRLRKYGINLADDNICDKNELENYRTKADYINNYIVKNNIEQAYFIDDNSNNLAPCDEYISIVPILAGWGNVAIGEVGKTEEEVLEIING